MVLRCSRHQAEFYSPGWNFSSCFLRIPCRACNIKERDDCHANQLDIATKNECLVSGLTPSDKDKKSGIAEVGSKSRTSFDNIVSRGCTWGRNVAPSSICKIVLYQSLHWEKGGLTVRSDHSICNVRATQTIKCCV
jgi:hypothetical protein